jgi:hypothetical protein
MLEMYTWDVFIALEEDIKSISELLQILSIAYSSLFQFLLIQYSRFAFDLARL